MTGGPCETGGPGGTGSGEPLPLEGITVIAVEQAVAAWLFEPAVKNGPGWPHPVIHDGKLYLRDNDALMCYDVRE